MTTVNQQIFSDITGYEGSWCAGGADQDGYEDESISDLEQRAIDTLQNIDFELLNSLQGKFDSKKVAEAVYALVRYNGKSSESDEIYMSLDVTESN